MDTKHERHAPRRSQRGLTLVEATIVIAVTAIVAAAAAPSLAAFIDGRRLDAAATALAADVQFVRGEAIARNRPVRLSFHSTAGLVAVAAVPASLGLASRSDTGERFVSYRCLVTPRADGRWSGRATLVPSGWSIGTGSADRRVCRYANDRDGSGTIDANIEHPAGYVDVAGALPAQNFLVVRGDQACPGVPDGGMLSAGLGTVQHQP